MSSQWECSCLNMWVKSEVMISDCLVLCSCLVYLGLTLGFWFQVGSHSCRQGDSGSRGKTPPPLFVWIRVRSFCCDHPKSQNFEIFLSLLCRWARCFCVNPRLSPLFHGSVNIYFKVLACLCAWEGAEKQASVGFLTISTWLQSK